MARETPTVRGAALRLLSRREHSRGELRRKLTEKFGREFAGEIERTLDDLAGRDLLSDIRFARAYAREVCGKFAARRIRAELKKRGVGEDETESALAEIGMLEADSESELARAREMIARRRRADGEDSDSIARENARLMRWLAARGFSFETARRAVEKD